MSTNEKASIAEEHYSYAKYLAVLRDKTKQHRLSLEVIGTDTSERTGITYPIYRLLINPQSQTTICIVTGVHGNEIAGPLSILHLIPAALNKLPKEYRYVIYPVVNPSGYDLRQRFDADGRDLNAIYATTLKSKNYREVQIFFEDACQFAPFEAVLTLHEDSELEKFYMYGLGEENQDFYHAICEFARTWVPAWVNADIYGCQSDERGFILSTARDHAFDAALYTQGLAKIACTLEAPGRLDLHFRINMMTQLVIMSIEMLNARRWMVSPYGKRREPD